MSKKSIGAPQGDTETKTVIPSTMKPRKKVNYTHDNQDGTKDVQKNVLPSKGQK